MRRFEYVDDKSSKFWEVEQAGTDLNIRWGKIGTTGQSQTKPFADETKAQAAMNKLISEKTGKGYNEVGVQAGASIGTAAPLAPKTPKAPTTSTTPSPSSARDAEEKSTAPAIAAPAAPAESLDAQSDRAFKAFLEKLAKGDFQKSESFTPARLSREFSISDMAALQVIQRAAATGMGWFYNRSLSLDRKLTTAQAQSCLDTLARYTPAPGHAAQPVSDQEKGSMPPWLWQGTPLRLMPEIQEYVLPSRRFPQPLPEVELRLMWRSLCRDWLGKAELRADKSEASLQPLVNEVVQRLQINNSIDMPARSDALILAFGLNHNGLESMATNWFRMLKESCGIVYALECYAQARSYEINTEYLRSSSSSGGRELHIHVTLASSASRVVHHHHSISEFDRMVYACLSTLPEADYQQAVEKAFSLLPRLPQDAQVKLALWFMDTPELANQVALALEGTSNLAVASWLQFTVTDPAAMAVARKIKNDSYYNLPNTPLVATLLQEWGVNALDALAPYAAQDEAGQGLTCIGLPEAVEALARVASSSKNALFRLMQAVERWPVAATAALARLVAADGKEASLVLPTLQQLLHRHPELPEQLAPWIEPSANQVLVRLQQQFQEQSEQAGDDELPGVLVNPPWLAKTRKRAAQAIELPQLTLAPVEQWDEGEREQKQGQILIHDYYAKQFEAAQKSARNLLEGLYFYRSTKTGSDIDQRALSALEAQDAPALMQAWVEKQALRKAQERYFYTNIDALYILAMPEKVALEFCNQVIPPELRAGASLYREEVLFAHYGLAILPCLVAAVTSRPAETLPQALNFGATELAPFAARAFAKLKTLKDVGQAWLLRFPEHAVCGLIAPALGKAGEARDCAAAALRMLAGRGHEALIMEVAQRYQRPEVLEAVNLVLNEDPLDRFPSKRTSMPEFWQPGFWKRPVLKNGKALPDHALQHLGTMLTFPTQEELYAGLEQVKQACTPQSLADFVWDVFCAWINTGGVAKENWALTMLGYLGNDDTARKLTPFIRTWPGEAAHARAVTGLDVLANIGTDVALMMLNGIAQKLKFKGLQDRAREKINQIAEARGLTLEELEDRLAPDLGLEADGSLILDFGPRQFKVGFDENLKPYVREVEEGRIGARLADLPKPKKTDDPELGAAAVERFKLLKKDARTIASQQVQRLETAMCTRRRWTPEVFQQFLVEHPLVRHLVQRLIWGVYRCETGEQYGGELLACFRVSEDGSFTTADDDAWVLPPGEDLRIGLPHALELPQEIASAFGQLFADYELLQPFAQLGRETYTLTEAELEQEKLQRWEKAVVPTGKVLGLVNKGWRRGDAQDGGGIWYFTKALGNGRHIELDLDPGIIVGMVNEYPEQTLGTLIITKTPGSHWGQKSTPRFKTLDRIILSELIRDMEGLKG